MRENDPETSGVKIWSGNHQNLSKLAPQPFGRISSGFSIDFDDCQTRYELDSEAGVADFYQKYNFS